MKTPNQDYQQPKARGGEQKVILSEKETAETDELDPKFEEDKPDNRDFSDRNKIYKILTVEQEIEIGQKPEFGTEDF